MLKHNFAHLTEESIDCGGHDVLVEVKPMAPKYTASGTEQRSQL
jgi:hypothetical protein